MFTPGYILLLYKKESSQFQPRHQPHQRGTITAHVCRASAHNTINTIQSHWAPCHRGWASGYLCFLLGIYNLPSLESQCWCVNRQQELSIKSRHHLRPPPAHHTDLSTSGLPQANTAPGGPRLTNPSWACDSDGNGISTRGQGWETK